MSNALRRRKKPQFYTAKETRKINQNEFERHNVASLVTKAYKDFVVVELIKLLGYKVIVHYHNKGVATCQDKWLDDKLYRIFFKNIKVILLADALYQDVEKYVKREYVFICPNGIPTSLDVEPTSERNNVIPQLLFLSNLLVDKGVLVLLDALKILKERGIFFCL